MEVPESKVYCSDCSHFVGNESYNFSEPKECCRAPSNRGNYYAPGAGFKREPHDKNGHNDCKDFKGTTYL